MPSEVSTAGTLLNDHVETDWVQTPAISRPEPETEPPTVEISVEDVPSEMDRWVGFSGGKDSLAVTHYAMSHGLAEGVVYCDTGSGLSQNLDYVRKICSRHGWPLLVVPPRYCYEFPAMRYGFPGPDYHSFWFDYCKGDGWKTLWNQIDGDLKLVTGVRREESATRMKTVTSEVQHEEGNFRGWFISPMWESDDDDLEGYLETHDLETNPCYAHIGRSGDCYCLAYAGRDELLELAARYPGHYHWLANAERRVQEYRGRLKLLEDLFPATIEYARDDLRKRNGTPYPLMHEVLKKHLPAHYEWAAKQPRRRAVLRGMQEPTAWLAHGGESSQKLQQAVAEADQDQTTLCGQSCNKRSIMGLSPDVKAGMRAAKKQIETVQQTLVADGGRL
jgi:3'-phosphoadenosine 5'-phosphosulfate sulfotransferase (PAPS reductase)/FAD synthetase